VYMEEDGCLLDEREMKIPGEKQMSSLREKL
jgi:hypothetical protein